MVLPGMVVQPRTNLRGYQPAFGNELTLQFHALEQETAWKRLMLPQRIPAQKPQYGNIGIPAHLCCQVFNWQLFLLG